mmetsp:Transcript_2608/g.5068  ORF Transcript_2608/g.5068 Transcript_2608/m.5068 type:complete len:564 (-) Transcript_2608:5-1696(-)
MEGQASSLASRRSIQHIDLETKHLNDYDEEVDSLLTFLIGKTKDQEDRRFEEHGTKNATQLYEEFVQCRKHIEKEVNSPFRIKSFFDSASYDCRDVPSRKDGSLKLLFQYYCRLLTPTGGAEGLTLENIQVANDTISLQELTCFVCNFKIVPNLVSHAGVHFAWQRQRRARENDEHPTELNYMAFVEVLVRVALIAFDELENPKERVWEMAAYLDLEHVDKYRRMIKSLEQSRNGEYRPKVNIAQNLSTADESDGPHEEFTVVPHKRERWSTISMSPPSLPKHTRVRTRTTGKSANTVQKEAKRRHMFWEADRLYDPSFLGLLNKYAFVDERKAWLPFDGECLDMGVLVLESTHRYKIQVQNWIPKMVYIEVAVLDIPNVTVTFDTREMPMGISRDVFLEIECKTLGEFLGWIVVTTYDSEYLQCDERSFPIYCHVTMPSMRPIEAVLPNTVALGSVVEDQQVTDESPAYHRGFQLGEADCNPRRPVFSSLCLSPKQTTTPKNGVTGMSLSSPGTRLSKNKGKAEEKFERKPLPISLMPRSTAKDSLPCRRASFAPNASVTSG